MCYCYVSVEKSVKCEVLNSFCFPNCGYKSEKVRACGTYDNVAHRSDNPHREVDTDCLLRNIDNRSRDLDAEKNGKDSPVLHIRALIDIGGSGRP